MKKIILLGLLSFVVFMLIKAPASLLLPYVDKIPYFQVQNITGNIFSANLQTTGKIDTLSYQIKPWSLLLAELHVEIRAANKDNYLVGNMAIDLFTQQIKLSEVTGVINLVLLQQYIPELSTAEPRGKLFFKDMNVVWKAIKTNPIPQQLSGNIELSKFSALGQNFGDYQLFIETQKSNLIGILSSQKSAAAHADVKLHLDEKKQFSIVGRIIGNDDNTKAILKQLNLANINKTIRLQ